MRAGVHLSGSLAGGEEGLSVAVLVASKVVVMVRAVMLDTVVAATVVMARVVVVVMRVVVGVGVTVPVGGGGCEGRACHPLHTAPQPH